MFGMTRRDVIALLCGAAAAWPFAARAQESRQVRLVGIFYNYGRADDPVTTAEIGAFKEALWRLGWSEGRNVRFEEHLNPPNSATRRKLAKELVAIKPDVILTSSTPATTAVFAETRTIPVVFVSVSDPVGSGFAVSLSHPDGNVTGFTNFEATIGQKWLELLIEIAPHIRRSQGHFQPGNGGQRRQLFFSTNRDCGSQAANRSGRVARSKRRRYRARDRSSRGVVGRRSDCHTGYLHVSSSGPRRFIDDAPPPTLGFWIH